MVDACPGCDSSQINERITMSPVYRCVDCGAEFDEPVERGRKKAGPGVGSSLGKTLRDADPDIITDRRKA